MRLLLDTHSFLWFIEGNARLSGRARTLIEDNTNDVFLSLASVWEMAIKISLGKLHVVEDFQTFISQQCSQNNIELLDITLAHSAAVIPLPFHHRDPFDRLLIAQSLVEQMPLVSDDPAFDLYPISRLW